MKEEYLKYCRYYKGEKEPPADKDYDTFTRFWYLEFDYFENIYEDEHEYWEGEGIEKWCKGPKPFHDFLMKQEKTTRGFLAYSAIASYSHSPAGGIAFIMKYGK